MPLAKFAAQMKFNTLTDRLSDYVFSLRYEQLPSSTVREVKRWMIDSFGWCAHIIEQQDNNRLIRPKGHYVDAAETESRGLTN